MLSFFYKIKLHRVLNYAILYIVDNKRGNDMKKVLKIVLGLLVTVYLVIVVFTTALLLNRNDYGVSTFLGKYLVFVEDKKLEPTYNEHSLLVISRVDNLKVEEGTKTFFYDTYAATKKIKFTEVTKREDINEKEATYTLKDNTKISSEYVLGTEKSTMALNILGQFLYIVQSRWGFLFIVVFPLFLAFVYEIYSIYKEVKNK